VPLRHRIDDHEPAEEVWWVGVVEDGDSARWPALDE
jgi:hypothetical protein